VQGRLDNPIVRRFWRVLRQMEPEETRFILKFVSGLTLQPNARQNPAFRVVTGVLGSPHPGQALPTAATCFQTLHLPEYPSDDICRAKLLYAVEFWQTMENKG
jgi:hypothetical protein